MEEIFSMIYYSDDLLKTACCIFIVAMMFELIFTVIALLRTAVKSA